MKNVSDNNSINSNIVFLITFLMALFSCSLLAQNTNPPVEWSKTLGGSGLSEAYSLDQTEDGGFIVAGYTTTKGAGAYDFWLVKLNSEGTVEWDKTFGGAGYELAWMVKQTSDNGFIVAGWTTSYGSGEYDLFMIKTDYLGNEEWRKIYGGTSWDLAMDIQQTPDGGYIMAGESWVYSNNNWNADGWAVKTNSAGEIMWQKKFGGNHRDIFFAVEPTSDGGYVFSGFTMSLGSVYGSRDNWLVKLDENGNELWNKTYDGNNGEDWARDVKEAPDGGFVIACASKNSTQDKFDFCIIKTDKNGNEIWKNLYGGEYSTWGRSIYNTSDGGYIASGQITVSSDINSETDLWLLKINSNGEEEWSERYGESPGSEDAIYMVPCSDGYIIAGTRIFSDSRADFIVTKTKALILGSLDDDFLPSEFRLLQNYPNPFNPSTSISFNLPKNTYVKIDIYNSLGSVVSSLVNTYLLAGSHSVIWNGRDSKGNSVPSGVYFCELKTEKLTSTIKMNLVK